MLEQHVVQAELFVANFTRVLVGVFFDHEGLWLLLGFLVESSVTDALLEGGEFLRTNVA